MLKQRILTAVILIPLVLWIIFKSSVVSFITITLLFTLAAAWEWARLCGVTSYLIRFGYCFLLAAMIYTNFLHLPEIFALLTPIWWLIALYLLIYFQKRQKPLIHAPWRFSFIGLMVLASFWLNLNTLRYIEPAPNILLFFLLLIWTADIGAYFFGKSLGKHKLAPMISPNKTWEGVLGGIICSLVLALVFVIYLQLKPLPACYFIILSIITVIFSMVGDLFESILKRTQGLKDSGHLFPGHGGILDRIDSLLAAAPIFAMGLTFQQTIQDFMLRLA